MGKTFFVEKILKNYYERKGIEFNVVNSDRVRKQCMDNLKQKQKNLTNDQLFEKTGKEANKIFMDSIETKLRINLKPGSV